MNIMLFFLAVGSTIFTPVTFMSSAACLIDLIGGLTAHEVLPSVKLHLNEPVGMELQTCQNRVQLAT